VNGCCYGQEQPEDRGVYLKKCGQVFWSFISGDEELYKTIIEPLGYKAKERNEEFFVEYGKVRTRFIVEFAKDFCESDSSINWKKLVEFNSGCSKK